MLITVNMAYEIADFTGTVLAPSVANPYGGVVDAPGGTVVDKKMVWDLLVFAQRMMSLAGVTPNNLADDTTNTFQLYEAFITSIENQIINTKRSYAIGAGQGGYLRYITAAGSLPIVTLGSGKQELTLGYANTYEFNLSTSPAHDVVTFGTDIAAGYQTAFYWEPGAGTFTITLNSTNTSGKPMIVQNGVAAPDTTFTPVTGKTYWVIRRTSVWEIIV